MIGGARGKSIKLYENKYQKYWKGWKSLKNLQSHQKTLLVQSQK